MGKAFRWKVKPSSAIGQPLRRKSSSIRRGLSTIAATHAARAEAEMKANAPWHDRTAFARSSLYGRREETTIYLGTANAEYGLYLELGTSRMAPRPIIIPTLGTMAQAYFEDAVQYINRVLFNG